MAIVDYTVLFLIRESKLQYYSNASFFGVLNMLCKYVNPVVLERKNTRIIFEHFNDLISVYSS